MAGAGGVCLSRKIKGKGFTGWKCLLRFVRTARLVKGAGECPASSSVPLLGAPERCPGPSLPPPCRLSAELPGTFLVAGERI